MVPASRVGICLDESIGAPLAPMLRDLSAPGAPDIRSVAELGLRGTTDEVLLGDLGKRGFAALVAMDSSMLSASVRRDAWRASGVTLFLFAGKWNDLGRFEKARGLIWWWPIIARQATDGPQGGAWRVPTGWKPDGLERLLPAQRSGAAHAP